MFGWRYRVIWPLRRFENLAKKLSHHGFPGLPDTAFPISRVIQSLCSA